MTQRRQGKRLPFSSSSVSEPACWSRATVAGAQARSLVKVQIMRGTRAADGRSAESWANLRVRMRCKATLMGPTDWSRCGPAEALHSAVKLHQWPEEAVVELHRRRRPQRISSQADGRAKVRGARPESSWWLLRNGPRHRCTRTALGVHAHGTCSRSARVTAGFPKNTEALEQQPVSKRAKHVARHPRAMVTPFIYLLTGCITHILKLFCVGFMPPTRATAPDQ